MLAVVQSAPAPDHAGCWTADSRGGGSVRTLYAQFKTGRDFVAWLGLVSRQYSSGGKERLGRVTKVGQADI